jgi:hypothetical protein
MNILLDSLILWGIVSPIAGFFAGKTFVKPKIITEPLIYEKHDIVQKHPRGIPADLKYGFTLDGKLTGELVPFGVNPVFAARIRSQKEGKVYSVQRV